MFKHSFMFIIIFIGSFYLIGFLFWALIGLIIALLHNPSHTLRSPQGVLFSLTQPIIPFNLNFFQNPKGKEGAA